MPDAMIAPLENDLYIPGRYYHVPVVRGTFASMDGDWVVSGPEHDDAEVIGFEHRHWHVHPQFLKPRHWHENGLYNGSKVRDWLNTVILSDDCDDTLNTADAVFIGIRRKKCWRKMPEYCARPPWADELTKAMRDKPLGPRRICPHRGADLSHVPVRDGCIQCPLHGLTFDAETGLVREFPDRKAAT